MRVLPSDSLHAVESVCGGRAWLCHRSFPFEEMESMVDRHSQFCQTSSERRFGDSFNACGEYRHSQCLTTGHPRQDGGGDTTGEINPAPWRQNFVNALLGNQVENGSWKPCGQLSAQKRPLRETIQVTTAWTMLALGRSHATTQRTQQALELLKNESPVSTKWWAVRFLLANQRGDADAETYSDGLLEKQQPDGGWG